MARKKDSYYFDSMVELIEFACKAAVYLEDTIKHYDPADISLRVHTMHTIEHSADLAKHEVVAHLAKEFITPIELEDIMAVIDTIDDVVDTIEDVALNLYMYNITSIRPEAVQFTELVTHICAVTKNCLEEFKNFRKSSTLHTKIIQVNELEEAGDKLHTESVRSLYSNPDLSAIEVTKWTEVFLCLENCCDACEDVTDAIQSTVMKNS